MLQRRNESTLKIRAPYQLRGLAKAFWTSGPHSALCVPLYPQNPDIVLVHYLNVPALEDCGKGCSPIFCSISSDRREWLKWSREELLGQLKPMCKATGPGQSSKGRVDPGASHGSKFLYSGACGVTMLPQARRLLSWVGGYQGSWCDLRCSTMEGSCELQVGAVWGLLAAVPLAGSLRASQVLGGAIRVLWGLFCRGSHSTSPQLSSSSWHQMELWKWDRGVLRRAAGAADPRHPPDQACTPNPRLSLQWGPW